MENEVNSESSKEKPTSSQAAHLLRSNFAKPSKGVISALLLLGNLGIGLIAGGIGAYLYLASQNTSQNSTSFLNTKVNIQESSAVIDVVNKVKPAVVSITGVTTSFNYFGGSSSSEVAGTGYIVRNDGLIVTNKHVVSGASNFTVLTNDGKQYSAAVKATDPVYDIAILKINATGLPTVALGTSDSLSAGQTVVAIGNALGQYQNSVTAGVISGIGRVIQASDSNGSSTESLDNVIQTDAAINSGNSGGPLINIGGQVIGMNTAVDSTGQGIGFAIPINLVKSAFTSYLANGKIIRPMLGVSYIPITKELASQNNLPVSQGAYIYGSNGGAAVVSGSPADKAGLKAGDIITTIAGEQITDNNTLITLINKHNIGDSVKITFLRNNKSTTISVTLAGN